MSEMQNSVVITKANGDSSRISIAVVRTILFILVAATLCMPAWSAQAVVRIVDQTGTEIPGSRIEVNFVEDGGSSNTGLILAVIGASAGGLTLVTLLGFVFFAVYLAGRRGGLA